VRRIEDEQQLVYAIRSASFTPPYAVGSLSIWATLEADKLPAAETAIVQELSRLKEELVSPSELAKAKKQKIADHIFDQQTVQGRARTIGVDMLSTHNPTFSEAYVQNIQRVTAEDIRRVAQQYVHESTLVRVVVRPASGPASTVALAPPEAAGAIVKKVLANGMTLLLKRNPALPVVTVQAFFKGGVRVETPDTNGLSDLMVSLLVKGTTSRSAEEIATTFEALGGTLNVESGNNSFFVTASFLKEDFPTALEIYADIIQHPSFPEEELEKMRRLMLAAVAQQNDDWQAEVTQLFRETFFTVSPYRLQPEGSAKALQRLQRQDVVAFYQRYAVPSNMVLAIAGDIDVAATASAVERAFVDLPPRTVTFPNVPAEPRPTQARRQVKQTQKQVAALYVGFPGTTIADVADRYPLHILDAVMSGIQGPGGWLHHELRGKQLVYVVHAMSWLGLEPGYFGIYAATQPDKVDEVINLILQAVEKAKAGIISHEELERAKQTAVVTAHLQRQTNEQLTSEAALNELYGLGYTFSDHEQARLEKVTKADVQRVAQTYLHHPTIVITTPVPAPR
jgi:zinc protease